MGLYTIPLLDFFLGIIYNGLHIITFHQIYNYPGGKKSYTFNIKAALNEYFKIFRDLKKLMVSKIEINQNVIINLL